MFRCFSALFCKFKMRLIPSLLNWVGDFAEVITVFYSETNPQWQGCSDLQQQSGISQQICIFESMRRRSGKVVVVGQLLADKSSGLTVTFRESFASLSQAHFWWLLLEADDNSRFGHNWIHSILHQRRSDCYGVLRIRQSFFYYVDRKIAARDIRRKNSRLGRKRG
jgi:hypothetical protein